MLVGIGLVYVIMVILCALLLVRFVILCALLLAVFAAFVVLAMTGRALDLSVLISLLMLIDIVVPNATVLRDLAVATNAIVLLDLAQHKIEAGADVRTVLLDPTHSPLRSYVDGGGLVVLGGPDSYGVDGYTDSALDDVLPVSMKLPHRKDTPSVVVALIIEDLETACSSRWTSRRRG